MRTPQKDEPRRRSVVASLRLSARLYRLGLPRHKPVVPHTNRRVLVSLTTRGALRVHAGYAAAPDEVLSAIVRWARPRVRSAEHTSELQSRLHLVCRLLLEKK